MSFIIDTNILMDWPQIITKEDEELVIITDILRELDGLKMNTNPEIAFKARRAAILISRNMDSLIFDDNYEDIKIPVDDKLLRAADDYDNGILITNDVYLKIKATLKGIETHGYGDVDEYGGVRTILLAADDRKYHSSLEYILENKKLPDGEKQLNENEYLIVKNLSKEIDGDYELLFIGVCRNNQIEEIRKTAIYNSWINKITPRNLEQICLFDTLQNKSISIVYAGGTYGTGKSHILNNYAIGELERGHIDKIVYVPNNAFTEDTMEIGCLPGEILDKTVGQIGPLIDLVGIDQIQSWIDTGNLEVVPMAYMRGRSFQNSIIIVNEAQNLTEDHVKLLLARVGNGSRIFYDGDMRQADSQLFKNKNGLKLLLNLRNSPIYSKIFATVKLKNIERSLTARASDYLDKI